MDIPDSPVDDTLSGSGEQGFYLNGKNFPAPRLLKNADYTRESELFGAAPWFDRDMIDNDILIKRYATDGWLPGMVPVEAVTSWCWRMQYACRDNDLFVSVRVSREQARAKFARAAMDGFHRIKTWTRVFPSQSCFFMYRTAGEQEYLERLNRIPAATIEAWRGKCEVNNTAWCGAHPLFAAEFRYLDKRASYWTDFVRHERRMRAKYGLAIPYQCLTAFDMQDDFRVAGFPRLTSFWRRIEVPRGCCAELPPVFTYKAEQLMDPESGWWVVAYTEFVLRVAAYLLFDAYDNLRVWAMSPDMTRLLKEIDLVGPLGSEANSTEALRIVAAIESINFDNQPENWRSRGNYASGSTGRNGPGADYVYYNVCQDRLITEREASELAQRRRVIPDGHPRGWDHVSVPEGWASTGTFTNPLAAPPAVPMVTTPSTPRAAPAGPSNGVRVSPTGLRSVLPASPAGLSGAVPASPAGASGAVRVRRQSASPAGSPRTAEEAARLEVSKMGAIREFLLEVGFDPDLVRTFGRAELRGYVRGRLDM